MTTHKSACLSGRDEVEKLVKELDKAFGGFVSLEDLKGIARFILRRELESRIDELKKWDGGGDTGFVIKKLTQQLKELQ